MLQGIHPTKLILGLLGAPIAALSAWLCSAVAKYGVHLDKSGVNALAVAGATAGVSLIIKLIHDVEASDPALAKTVSTIAADVSKAVDVAVKVDPQLAQAATQAEHVVEKTIADAWPADPPPQATDPALAPFAAQTPTTTA